MNVQRRIKSFAVVMFFLGFLSSASLTSCGNKAATEETEATEQPAEKDAEHPTEEAAEHPKADSVDEHPKADSIQTETTPQ